MKKALLFGTTALVAGSMFAADAIAQEEGAIVVGISGFHRQYVSFQDNDDNGLNVVDQWSDSEIIFGGKTQVMGGLEVGFNVQLETETDRGDIDESYIFVEGAFGRVVMGSENTPAYLMQYAAPAVGPGINSGFQSQSIIGTVARPIGPGIGTFIEVNASGDNQHISYYTPRFNGFQLGLGLLPDVTGEGNSNQIDNAASPVDWGLSVGANYVQDFEDFNVAVAFGFTYADSKTNALDDPMFFSGGLNLGYQGFTIGGSIAGSPTDNYSEEGLSWDAGIRYGQDRWAASVTYFDNDMTEQDFESWAVEGAVSYRLGTGVDVVGYIGYAATECDTQFNGTANNVVGQTGCNAIDQAIAAGATAAQIDAAGAEDQNDGVYGGVGIRTSF